ncbi:MAG: hypothetical protein WA634_10590 [Silvibacterium sp.]
MQTQPVEDIDAVLGRFQAWAGSRHAVGSKLGIRELPYEEAVQSRRYRWKAGNETPAKKKPGAGPDVIRVAAPVAAESELVRQKPGASKVRDAKRETMKKNRGRGHAAKTDHEARIAPATKTAPVAKYAPTAKLEKKPEFRDVLAETVRPSEAIVAAQPMELARQVAISIRLAPAERALIKTRAAEAGISASAYIRQCALEVEQLRAQVQQTLAVLERKAPLSVPIAPPGFFARMMRRLFRRNAPALALRA